MMYHMLWTDRRNGLVFEGYATEDQYKQIDSKHHVQIIYIREIAVSKASE